MIDLFFSILNFVVLLFVLTLVTKYILIPMLSQQRHKEEQSFRNLVKERTKTHELYRNRIQKGQDAKHLIHQLRGKVQRWNAVVSKQDSLDTLAQNKQKEKAYEIQKRQHKAMRSTIAYKQTIPYALNQARQELVKNYQEPSNQKSYMASIFKAMEEKQ